ncbi:MAG: sortase [Chloroflexia bacterium]
MDRTITPSKFRLSGKWPLVGLVALLALAALAALLLGRPANRGAVVAVATPTSQVAASLDNTPLPPTAAIPLDTPSPYVVVKPSDLLPNPAASETVPVPVSTDTSTPIPPTSVPPTSTAPPTEAPVQAQAPTSKPTAKPTAKPAPKKKTAAGPLILPNGVRYGDHKPNLPGRIVRIASPNIKLDTPVYEVYVVKNLWEVADYAAGHNYNAKNPGEGGNIVLAGHNNWRGEVFRYLEFLKPGNEIDVWTLEGKKYRYQVTDIKKLKEAGASLAQRVSNGHVMDPTPFEQLTLITCWPYTTYTHRLIVTALPMQ